MKIEEELINFLHSNAQENDNKRRNVDIVAYYYGFRDSKWPTYDETAKVYAIGTRERVRQIINKTFRDIKNKAAFPALNECAELLMRRNPTSTSDYTKLLASRMLIDHENNIRGLLNLMHDLDLCADYEIYTPDLQKVTRSSIDKYNESYIISQSKMKETSEYLRKAKSLPGMLGIANFEYVRVEIEELSMEQESILKSLIINSQDSWISNAKEFWYIFENRDNTLINYSEKVFGITDRCNIHRLAEVYKNALSRRTSKYQYPPVEIIEEYLRNSRYFAL